MPRCLSGGTIVGSYTTSPRTYGFIYDGSTFDTLDEPQSSHFYTVANGMSDGTVVGTYGYYGVYHGFIATPIRPALKGDLNVDGKVDFSDLLILAQNYGRTGATPAEGDIDGDGTVGFGDLLLLAQNYGDSTAVRAKRLRVTTLTPLERVLNFRADPAVQAGWQGSLTPAMGRIPNGTLSSRT